MTRLPTIAALLASGLAAAAAPAAAQDALSIEDLFDLQYVGGGEVSPDGAAIAYRLSSPRNVVEGEENGPAKTELRVAFGAGDNRLYVPADKSPNAHAWRDAETLAFLADAPEGETNALYTMNIAGGAPEVLFQFDESISHYVFADGGRTLYFSAREADDKTDTALKDKGFDANLIDESGRFTRLYRVDLSADEPEASALDLEGQVSYFDVGPNGARLIVALAETTLVNDDIINRTFHLVDARTGEVENRIDTAGKIGRAEFSPDGSRIAFLAGVDRSDPVATTIAVADAATGEFRFLTDGDEADEIDFVWTGNSSLTVLAHRGTASEIFTLSVDGESADRRTQDGFVLYGIDAAGGTMAATGARASHPAALFAAKGGAAFTKWTDHNAWLAERALGDQELVSWKARDGVTVEGLLVTPTGRAPRRGWPTITVVHGGPEAHYSNAWLTRYSSPGHIGAGEGYAVFYPNYRGSTGRGQDFAKLDHADPPAAEFNDIIDGLDYLAGEGLIDREKVGITGGSYGGYASAWGATALSEHFAAAVVFVALTDLTSFMGTTDIPTEMIDSHFMKYPEGNWDMYREQSPIYHAAKSKTPTLILHGEADPRVHPSQSLELFRYLERVGQAPVRLVTYPGEGHGNRKAAGQYDYALRLMRWMDHYLKGDGGAPPPSDLPTLRALVEENDDEA